MICRILGSATFDIGAHFSERLQRLSQGENVPPRELGALMMILVEAFEPPDLAAQGFILFSEAGSLFAFLDKPSVMLDGMSAVYVILCPEAFNFASSFDFDRRGPKCLHKVVQAQMRSSIATDCRSLSTIALA